MGDPYPEEEAQRLLDELKQTAALDRARPGQASDLWRNAATGLEEVAAKLGNESKWNLGGGRVWMGEASALAGAAFDKLAAEFTQHAQRMRQIGEAVARGEAEIGRVADRINGDIGTELKSKPKGGLFGSLPGLDDVAGAVGSLVSDPGKIVMMTNPITGVATMAHALAGADDANDAAQVQNREQQFHAIKQVHAGYCTGMDGQRQTVEAACPESATGAGSVGQRDGSLSFGGQGPAAGVSAYAASGGGDYYRGDVPSGGDRIGGGVPRGGDSPYVPRSPVTGAPLAPAAQADGADGGALSYRPFGDQGTASYGSSGALGGGGLSPGAGLLGGSAAAVGGLGAAVGGVMGASRLGGSGATADSRGVSGVIGGSTAGGAAGPGGVGAAGGAGSSGAAGAGARAGGGMGMMGGMGGGGAAGGKEGGPGARYGQAPQLSERGKRRGPGPKHAVLGAGSRQEPEGAETPARRRPSPDEDEDDF